MDPSITRTDKYKMKLVLKYSIIATVGYVIIFLLMRLMNLHYIVGLRGLNYVLLFIVTAFAIKTYKEESQDQMSYLEGFLTSFLITNVSFTLFPFLMYIYLKFLDRGFLEFIVNYSPMGIELSPLSAALLLFFEGHSVGIVISLILMQYFKKNVNKISKTI